VDLFSVVEQFYAYDLGLPLEERVVEAWESEGTNYEKLVLTTSSGERVPGELAVPGTGGPHPVVLLLHGLGNSRERWWEEDRAALRTALLAAGVAVFAIDLRFHGERSARNEYQNPVFLTFGDSLFVRNRDMIIQSTIDARRALDLLDSRPGLDPARKAVMGYSMGGMIALYLSALEPDLRAVVASAVPTTEQPLPLDHFNFVARARSSVLLQIGRTDWLSSPADARLLRDLIPVEDADLRFYESGHGLPPEFATDAGEWLASRLE
jgi:dienelactone hydrolase